MLDLQSTPLLEQIDPGLGHCRGIGTDFAEEFLRRVPPAKATKAVFDTAEMGLWGLAHAAMTARGGDDADVGAAFRVMQEAFLTRLQAVYTARLRPAGHA